LPNCGPVRRRLGSTARHECQLAVSPQSGSVEELVISRPRLVALTLQPNYLGIKIVKPVSVGSKDGIGSLRDSLQSVHFITQLLDGGVTGPGTTKVCCY